MGGIIIKRVDADSEIGLGFARPVTSVVSVLVASRQLVDGGAPIVASGLASGSTVDLVLAGGTDGERYAISVTAAQGAFPAVTREIEVAVFDPEWTMPGGGAAWLDIVEFVERLGVDEAIVATNISNTGTIDRSYLVSRLRDAQASAEAHVAARYALPLVTVPDVVKTAIADRARARLYPRGVPDGVGDAAKQAARVLERIASGALPLPLPAGESAAPAASIDPIAFHSEGRTYPDGLAGY